MRKICGTPKAAFPHLYSNQIDEVYNLTRARGNEWMRRFKMRLREGEFFKALVA